MAKPRTPNQKKKYAALNKRLAKYLRLIQAVYDETAASAASLALDTAYAPESGKPFRFNDYPKIRKKVNDLQSFFARDLHAVIMSATSEEWKQSNLVQDLLVKDVLKAYGIRRGGQKEKRYYQTNSDALKAFQQRKDGGFTISQKLWNQSENMRRELEYCISSAIEKGTSAVTLSKRISKYLQDFPQLQKDYKKRYGRAVECQNCEYRSIRLARSEINMAYRAAEQERWRQMDFIKGYEIKLSGAHPKDDICDDLAGIYPKSFKWLGWHPNCMCYCIPIIMTDDEYYSGNGERITEMPEPIQEWVYDNEERIEKWTKNDTLPYWLRDNTIEPKVSFVSIETNEELFRNRQERTRQTFRSTSAMRSMADNIYTGHLSLGLKDFDSLIAHCYDTDELSAIANIRSFIDDMPRGVRESLNKNRPNYRKKVKDGIKFFTRYEKDINGTTYVLKCKVVEKKRNTHSRFIEHPYSLKKKKGK